jgi:hypothetical protein
MAETVASLTAQLEALQRARATGVRRVEITTGNGVSKSTEYKDDAQMASAIADLQHRIAAIGGRKVSTILIATSKGL